MNWETGTLISHLSGTEIVFNPGAEGYENQLRQMVSWVDGMLGMQGAEVALTDEEQSVLQDIKTELQSYLPDA
ncbi:MAG: hypothetical protein KAR20_01665, partial [Candidatus Heimdallarchaeota archaeon]|nr:hypothetical protein [Candidatus Heimdallarchaeota archaeon]